MVRWGGKGGEFAALAVWDEEWEARRQAMPAVVRGAVALEPRVELEAARRALARAVAQGALGAGYAVQLDGNVVVFSGGAAGPESGRLELDAAHGQICVRYQLTVGAQERARVIQAILLATLTSLTATLLWSWMIHLAIPFGLGVGTVTAAANLTLDRRRLRRQVEALASNLPLLVDARGEQAG